MNDALALEAHGISKTYGHFTALQGVDLAIRPGVVVALFGRNGAGKTTFLKIAATLARPSAGRLRVFGVDVDEEPERVRRRIGFLSHNTGVYRDLTTWENLRFFARLYGLDRPEDRIREIIDRVGLDRRRHDPVRTFSRGLLQRVGLARTMLHDPQLLLLDEPYTGLDAQAVAILDGMLDQAVAAGRAVLLTTHDLEQGLRAASEVRILERGRLVFSAPAGDAGIHEAYGRYVRGSARG